MYNLFHVIILRLEKMHNKIFYTSKCAQQISLFLQERVENVILTIISGILFVIISILFSDAEPCFSRSEAVTKIESSLQGNSILSSLVSILFVISTALIVFAAARNSITWLV